jgi:hypothetical protein
VARQVRSGEAFRLKKEAQREGRRALAIKQPGVTDIRTWGAPRARRGDTEQEGAMRQMHDYKGWRFGLMALEQDGRWAARIEVYRPGTPSREQRALAKKHAEDWIDREAKRQGGA